MDSARHSREVREGNHSKYHRQGRRQGANCGKANVFKLCFGPATIFPMVTREHQAGVGENIGFGPNFLPRLTGGVFTNANLTLVLNAVPCTTCGLSLSAQGLFLPFPM